MIDEKCKDCHELVIPYFSIFKRPNHRLSDELKTGTCKCNIDSYNRQSSGYCGWYHPDKCKGPGHRYYFEGHVTSENIKFIN